ncbi:hypothetical protein RB195_013225 [Necator americanus]|uniref:Uncharacterized protein n=1 Tax=Necator americanus TaxID=51031 RepID=A0ABR1DUP7_NECAM
MRFNDNRWTRAVSDWAPRDIKRTTRRPPTRILLCICKWSIVGHSLATVIVNYGILANTEKIWNGLEKEDDLQKSMFPWHRLRLRWTSVGFKKVKNPPMTSTSPIQNAYDSPIYLRIEFAWPDYPKPEGARWDPKRI